MPSAKRMANEGLVRTHIHQFKLSMPDPGTLTKRQQHILMMMAEGRTSVSIAEELSISKKTVEAHRARIFYKLSARNIAEAIVRAFAAGVLRMEFQGQEGDES